MTDTALNDRERKDLDLCAKLLAKAAKTEHEAERDSFMAKAQEIMTRHNWDTVVIERASGATDGRREEMKVDGGFYLWQRELWKAVSELNFCFHFIEEYRVKLDKPVIRYHRIDPMTGQPRVKHSIIKKRHRLIGRTVNVRATQMLCDYLEGSIDRLLRERVQKGEGEFGSWANAFREGATSLLLEKISKKFKQRLAEERKQKTAAAGPRPTTGMTSTALTLTDIKQQEFAGNYDHLYGEGAWAKVQAARAEEARQAKEEEEAYTAWAKANPEEAARREKEEAERRRKMWSRYRVDTRSYAEKKADRMDPRAFHAGRDAAERIGLDPQVGGSQKRISHA